jgi:hypothetical protein
MRLPTYGRALPRGQRPHRSPGGSASGIRQPSLAACHFIYLGPCLPSCWPVRPHSPSVHTGISGTLIPLLPSGLAFSQDFCWGCASLNQTYWFAVLSHVLAQPSRVGPTGLCRPEEDVLHWLSQAWTWCGCSRCVLRLASRWARFASCRSRATRR